MAQKEDTYYRAEDLQSVSIYFQSADSMVERATASVSKHPDHWWFDRVFVYPTLRGRGLGKKLVLDVIERASKLGCTKFVVAPGGYNMKYKDQKAFYESCGFVPVKAGLLELETSGDKT